MSFGLPNAEGGLDVLMCVNDFWHNIPFTLTASRAPGDPPRVLCVSKDRWLLEKLADAFGRFHDQHLIDAEGELRKDDQGYWWIPGVRCLPTVMVLVEGTGYATGSRRVLRQVMDRPDRPQPVTLEACSLAFEPGQEAQYLIWLDQLTEEGIL